MLSVRGKNNCGWTKKPGKRCKNSHLRDVTEAKWHKTSLTYTHSYTNIRIFAACSNCHGYPSPYSYMFHRHKMGFRVCVATRKKKPNTNTETRAHYSSHVCNIQLKFQFHSQCQSARHRRRNNMNTIELVTSTVNGMRRSHMILNSKRGQYNKEWLHFFQRWHFLLFGNCAVVDSFIRSNILHSSVGTGWCASVHNPHAISYHNVMKW